jgi:actin-like ATPase involved in cell morphogenesis
MTPVAYVLGIDLGTTFTAAAVGRPDGRVEIAALGDRAASVPTVVVLRSDGEILVGEAAERRSLSEPGRTAREFKRRLGDPVPLVIGGTPYGAESLMAYVLAFVVAKVAEREGGPPDRVVVTHPASWTAFRKDLLEQAVHQSGLSEVTYLPEPEAAAVEYANLERLEPGQVVAVYDFGGGTFDAAVLRVTTSGFDLLGRPEGLERLGGIDLDQAVLVHVNQALGGLVESADRADPAVAPALARLRDECTKAKEALSADTDALVPIALPGLQTEVRITRSELESMVRPRIAETVAALERAVTSAGLVMDDVARILLVGGTSRIPLIAQLLRESTGRPVVLDANPKHVVAMGAARIAASAWAAAPVPAPAPLPSAVLAAAPLPPPVPTTKAPSGLLGRRRVAVAAAVAVAVLLVGGLAVALGGGSSKGTSALVTTTAVSAPGSTNVDSSSVTSTAPATTTTTTTTTTVASTTTSAPASTSTIAVASPPVTTRTTTPRATAVVVATPPPSLATTTTAAPTTTVAPTTTAAPTTTIAPKMSLTAVGAANHVDCTVWYSTVGFSAGDIVVISSPGASLGTFTDTSRSNLPFGGQYNVVVTAQLQRNGVTMSSASQLCN